MKKSSVTTTVAFLLSFNFLWILFGLQGCNSLNEGDLSKIIKFEYVDPLEKVLTEASYFPHKDAVSEVVRGENATLQFIVRSQYSITGLKVDVAPASNGVKSLPVLRKGFVGYVKVGRSIWDSSRDRLVSVSGYYPDPILEQESIDVDFGNTQPIWISIPIPINTDKGLYKGQVKITGKIGNKKFSMSKDYSVKVYPVTVEKTSLWVTNWFSTDTAQLKLMNGGRSFVPFSDQHWELIKILARKMADYRQNVAIISPLALSDFTFENGKWKTDFTKFDKMVDIFMKEGVIGRIEGGHIGGRESSWTSQFVVMVPDKAGDPQKKFNNLPISDQKAKAFYSDFIPALRDHLKEKGWDKIYMQHLADEPIHENVKSYIEIAKFIRNLAPDFKFIDACHSKDLGGMLDIWVPQLDYMNTDYEFYNKQSLSGKEIWTYTCLNPKFEYANRFIELPLLRTRYIHWINFKYNIPGYLHWGLNFWHPEGAFGEQTSIQYEGGNILPGGDGWIIYPKDGKLLSSIRFDAMRDGIVDYELFRMLEKRDPEKAKDIIDKVIYAFDKYDNNIEAFREHRRHLMELLSEKNEMPAATVWSPEKAREWAKNMPWLRGSDFIPSSAINQLEMWQAETFDTATIDRELGWAEKIGFNCMRVYLHHLTWEIDSAGFKQRINKYLSISAHHNIKTVFVIFDDCWNPAYNAGKQPDPKPGVHNSGWVKDPGELIYTNPAIVITLERYVKDLLRSFSSDTRILAWDLYNEPGNSDHGRSSMPLLKAVFKWSREINPSQPLTCGIWDGKLKEFNSFQVLNSDIISYHNYSDPATHQKMIDTIKLYNRPMICTEYMARRNNSLFSNIMPILKAQNIGAINWGFVSGKTNTIYAWDTPIPDGSEPALWFHDIFRKDGSPYKQDEINIIKGLTGMK